MTRLDTRFTLSDELPEVVTGAVGGELCSTSSVETIREEWVKVIDSLIGWAQMGWAASDQDDLADDGITLPSRKALSVACRIAFRLRECSWPLPASLRVVPNADGGIVFEWEDGPFFRTIEVDEDGAVEFCEFHGQKLSRRTVFEL